RIPLDRPNTSTSMMMAKGSAEAIVADCNAPRPPAISSTMATSPSIVHQKTRCMVVVSVSPPAAIVSTTSEPESEDVTKNTVTRITAMVEVTVGSGRNLKNSNSPTETSSTTAAEI